MERRNAQVTYKSGRTLAGVAIKFDTPSPDGRLPFIETFRPGSVNTNRNIRALYNHNEDALLGTTDAGTMRIYKTDKEIRYEVDLPNTTAGNDTLELAKRGDLKGASIGFIPKTDHIEVIGDTIFRDHEESDLHEISFVADPAHETTLEV